MTKVNGAPVPTCAELAEMLKAFGNKPLFSGNGWYTVYGFGLVNGGVQLFAQKCPPAGSDAKTRD